VRALGPSRSRIAAAHRALALIVVLIAAEARAYTPAVDYALNCQGCHLRDGTATPDAVPALAGSVARFLAVPGGREYLVRVPGVSQSALDDASLAAVLNWVVEEFDREHVPASFAPYTAQEVARLRTAPLIDVAGTRRRLLAPAEHAP
jgi:hypothetical protein